MFTQYRHDYLKYVFSIFVVESADAEPKDKVPMGTVLVAIEFGNYGDKPLEGLGSISGHLSGISFLTTSHSHYLEKKTMLTELRK